MKNILCNVFGHNYKMCRLVFSMDVQEEHGEWVTVSHRDEVSVCTRCNQLPYFPKLNIGNRFKGKMQNIKLQTMPNKREINPIK